MKKLIKKILVKTINKFYPELIVTEKAPRPQKLSFKRQLRIFPISDSIKV